MSERAALVWERECAVAALAHQQLCPRYHMPCWVCCLMHILTGTLRSVSDGRFDRFDHHRSYTWAHDPTGHFAKWLAFPTMICPHHAEATTAEYRQRSDRYWGGEQASAVHVWRNTDLPRRFNKEGDGN